MGTSVAPARGLTAVTVGGVVSGSWPVVNVQTKSAARLFPARSSTPVVTLAVYVVAYASGEDGVKVAVVPFSVTVPVTGPAPVRRTVVVETLAVATASENVAVTVVPTATFVASDRGVFAVTVGGVVSGACAVVNVQTKSAARLFPATSSTPVVTLAV
jgi:hypothetical protein